MQAVSGVGGAESARQAARNAAVLLVRLALEEDPVRSFVLDLSGLVAKRSLEVEAPAAGLLLAAFMGSLSVVLQSRGSGTSKVVCAKITGQMARHLQAADSDEAAVSGPLSWAAQEMAERYRLPELPVEPWPLRFLALELWRESPEKASLQRRLQLSLWGEEKMSALRLRRRAGRGPSMAGSCCDKGWSS